MSGPGGGLRESWLLGSTPWRIPALACRGGLGSRVGQQGAGEYSWAPRGSRPRPHVAYSLLYYARARSDSSIGRAWTAVFQVRKRPPGQYYSPSLVNTTRPIVSSIILCTVWSMLLAIEPVATSWTTTTSSKHSLKPFGILPETYTATATYATAPTLAAAPTSP